MGTQSMQLLLKEYQDLMLVSWYWRGTIRFMCTRSVRTSANKRQTEQTYLLSSVQP